MARRTVTMNWDRLDDFNDDNDEFYESTNRLSAVVPLDMPLTEIDYDEDDDDEQEFIDTRVSFSQNLAAYSIKDTKPTRNLAAYSIKEMKPSVATPVSNAQYDMWMVAPGSITDRRRRLLQDMGLNSRKDFSRLASTTNPKLNKAYTKRQASTTPVVTSLEKTKVGSVVKESSPHLNASKQVEQKHSDFKPNSKIQIRSQVEQSHAKLEPLPESQPQRHQESQADPKPQPEPAHEQNHAPPQSQSVLLVRSRSDSDIDTSSFNTKRRKEEIIGLISKQRLTRTASVLVTPSGGLSCQYANIVRESKPNTKLPKNFSTTTSNAQLDSFFLIKNLDTGKEFVVKESNEDGMWNKVRDLQTGKQLTMDEFESTVGHSPVVKELMRRTSRKKNGIVNSKLAATNSYLSKSFRNSKKKGAAILKSLKDSMNGSKSERSKEDCATETTTTTTTTNDKSSSTSSQTKEEQKTSGVQKPSGEQITSGEHRISTDKDLNSEWVKAKVYGKPLREFSALHICQQIVAHDGSIWTMRFSTDGHYLASGGEDKVIHIWEVQECDVISLRSGDDNGSITPDSRIIDGSNTTSDKKKKSKNSKKKSGVPDYVKVPESVFGLSQKPVCTFQGHQEDILDLAWSRSQLLISSSMDKTVRLWDIKQKSCLKQFAHSDYVTCIQFNPTDDDYFISGSLDKKVRIWSVPSRKVIDWSDLHDMITSVCYSPDGQVATVGLHNGNCISYSTTDCKLDQKYQIELHTKPKAEPAKITSFQFSPSNASEMLVTSADSRVRILDGVHVVNKLMGYRNTSSQFSAQYSADGKYVICASEDSQVYIWRHEKPKSSGTGKPKYVTTTSYEHFPCTDVTVAVPWSGSSKLQWLDNESKSKRDVKKSGPLALTPNDNSLAKKSSELPPVPKKSTDKGTNEDLKQPCDTDSSVGESSDGGNNAMISNSSNVSSTAWGLVIVTAGVSGKIRVYQNVGLPVKVGTNLF